VLGSGCQEIQPYAFNNCSSLKQVFVFTDGVVFGDRSFYGCKALEAVYYEGTPPTTVPRYAFSGTNTDLTFYYNEGQEGWTSPTWTAASGVTFNTEMVWEEPKDLLGDINLDGSVDIADAQLLFMHSMLPDLYPIDYTGNIDYTGDGAVDIADAQYLFMYSMLPDLYPIG
ncbi:MAG: leucine-rich repeat protein, partial [Clostridia bacterium]|nr:leucine-rich repeat protein [Clostridia bacterium]